MRNTTSNALSTTIVLVPVGIPTGTQYWFINI